jgi:hypothetical protein
VALMLLYKVATDFRIASACECIQLAGHIEQVTLMVGRTPRPMRNVQPELGGCTHWRIVSNRIFGAVCNDDVVVVKTSGNYQTYQATIVLMFLALRESEWVTIGARRSCETGFTELGRG